MPKETLHNYKLVFDAVYTPMWTRLLLDAKDSGCQVGWVECALYGCLTSALARRLLRGRSVRCSLNLC